MDQIINRLKSSLGENAVVTNPDDVTPFSTDRTNLSPGHLPLGVVFPQSTKQVQTVIQEANNAGISVVVSGGRTGYAGGAVATDRPCLILSMQKMNRKLRFDPYIPALTVEAGMITANVQKEAENEGFYFPVDFAAAGSSHIGGNLATHAGGIRVLKYGSVRRYVTGLTAVLGNGDLLESNHNVLKDNTGYDMKQLLIGSEGTLGVITEVTLQLVNRPPKLQTALVRLDSFETCLQLLSDLRKNTDLYAFEYFDDACYSLVRREQDIGELLPPGGHYCVFDIPLETGLENLASVVFPYSEDVIIEDTETKRRTLWKFRESISESLSHLKNVKMHKNDISVPAAKMADYQKELQSVIKQTGAPADLYVFGHIADGNLHINLSIPNESDFRTDDFDRQNYSLIRTVNGSISAEHGIGLLKKEALEKLYPQKVEIMKKIKQSFDPNGILNPGKIFSI